MILKSFYKDKKTKINIAIFSFIFLALLLVNLGKKDLIEEYKDNYENSFIFFNTSDTIDDLNKDNKIKSIEKGIQITPFILTVDSNVKEIDGIKLPQFLDKNYRIGEPYSIDEENNSYDFLVEGFYNTDIPTPILYINEEKFKELCENHDSGYIIRLNNWIDKESTKDLIEKKYKKEAYVLLIGKHNMDFEMSMQNYNLYSLIIYFIFIVLFIVTVYDIVKDNKIKKDIYRSIGYTKKRVFAHQILNLLSLFITSFCISIIITLIYTALR